MSGLVAAVVAAGLDGEDAPDLLAITGPEQEPGIVHAVFSRRRSARFGSLRHLADADALRELAARLGLGV